MVQRLDYLITVLFYSFVFSLFLFPFIIIIIINVFGILMKLTNMLPLDCSSIHGQFGSGVLS